MGTAGKTRIHSGTEKISMEFKVELGDRSYPILIEHKSLAGIGEKILAVKPVKQAAIISDETVSGIYGKTVRESLEKAGIETTLLTVPDGEGSKSLEKVETLCGGLAGARLKRDGLVVALGGGVVGDLAGFTAAVYLRGVPFVQIPTSLLAQVDSSVGGKVAVNLPAGKNLVGSFHQPALVLIDPDVLETLDSRDLWSGLAEMVKIALIRDEKFFSYFEMKLGGILSLMDRSAVSNAIAFCCRVKARVVSQDERESGLRRILNFGHTLGHALETITGFENYRHGEAVLWGMRFAAWLSMDQKFLAPESYERIETLLNRIETPPLPPDIRPEALASAMAVDKKQSSQGLHLVILENIGSAVVKSAGNLEPGIRAWLEYLKNPRPVKPEPAEAKAEKSTSMTDSETKPAPETGAGDEQESADKDHGETGTSATTGKSSSNQAPEKTGTVKPESADPISEKKSPENGG